MFRIRIGICKFLGLPDPGLLVRGPDPDSDPVSKTLIFTVFLLRYDYLSLKNNVNVIKSDKLF